jgi:polyhydroxyalkanoate synthesis regulator phasin
MTEPVTQPNHDTRFQKGQSGNPAGRPRGSRNRVTRLMEDLLQGEAETLTRVAIGRAMAGDPVALKLCLQRMMAPMRGRPIEIDLPAGDGTIATVAERLEATVAAVASGEITPDEAESIARVLQEQRQQIETADIDRRLMRLEEAARREDEARRAAAQNGYQRLPG